ncbi:hypothetical protein O6H91_12G025400 [Diphasiastrum complanatum]|uniref:Uncharacterized protein n=1 Tax=Diphasiastrum complanatum TaxID=34168 RepID=A0ACC2BZU3_DIPCM|nr:hypothetical protein O6H91_12G025400 [Diphasiastrum complanatum]
MASILQRQRLGAAYFDMTTSEMFVLETWEDGSDDFSSLQLLKHQTQPSVIYSSSKMEEKFLRALRRKEINVEEEDNVKLVKSSLFSYEQAWHRLVHIQLHGMYGSINEKERLHLLNSMINLQSEMQVRAAGGLLAILQQELIIGGIGAAEGDMGLPPIQRISELSLTGIVKMDEATSYSLQIFQMDKHPSHMGIGKSKEGFSLFGMLNKCVTPMGHRLLRTWFLKPLMDVNVLNDRLDAISFFKTNEELVDALRASLKQVKDIPRVLKKFFSPSSLSTSADWLALQKTAGSFLQIRRIIEATLVEVQEEDCAASRSQSMKRILSLSATNLLRIIGLIDGVIDFDQVCGENLDTMVMYGLCEELDELKMIYEGLPNFLDQVTTLELKRLPQRNMKSINGLIVYNPQIGYMLRVLGTRLDQNILNSLPDYQLVFEGGSAEEQEFFYHTAKTKELDNVLGDVYHKIIDMERAIVRELENRLEAFASTLYQAAAVIAELDCLLSFSISACEYNYNRPYLTDDDIIYIKNGRHALQELAVNTFVPNDTNLSMKGRVNVITGPNYSGKSVYIRQVALVVFLAHIGSFVPAEKATIGLTDRIFFKVSGKGTVAVPQSTFMVDLQNIAVILRYATSRSLCLIDEFGHGTVTPDGIGLLCASLKHLANYAIPPKVLACSHFSEIFEESFLPKSDHFSYHTMSILEPDKNKSPSNSDVIFLYRLVPGECMASYGLHCAELAGVPIEIVSRAEEILGLIREEKPVTRLQSARTTSKDEKYKELVQKLLAFDCKNGDVQNFLNEVQILESID